MARIDELKAELVTAVAARQSLTDRITFVRSLIAELARQASNEALSRAQEATAQRIRVLQSQLRQKVDRGLLPPQSSILYEPPNSSLDLAILRSFELKLRKIIYPL